MNQKCLENFEARCRRVKISWTDRVKNKEILHAVKEQGNFLRTTKRRRAEWFGHILRRYCVVQPVFEGMIKGRKDSEEGVST